MRPVRAWVLALSIGVAACSTRPGPPLHPEVQGGALVRLGERVWMQHCESCHPGGGTGYGPAVVRTVHIPDEVMRFQIRNGLGRMPAFGEDVISEPELDALIAYIDALERTLEVDAQAQR
jgi:mono/diheme cytochrome c family protein